MEQPAPRRRRRARDQAERKKGYILEVDLEYPRELHEKYNAYPLAPEKKPVKKEWFLPYQKRKLENLSHSPLQTKKLMLTLQDKEKYVVHYRNLQQSGRIFLVREVLLQRNAAHHNGRELYVVHCAAAGVGCEILFPNLFDHPADAGREPGQRRRVQNGLDKLVVGHGLARRAKKSIPSVGSLYVAEEWPGQGRVVDRPADGIGSAGFEGSLELFALVVVGRPTKQGCCRR